MPAHQHQPCVTGNLMFFRAEIGVTLTQRTGSDNVRDYPRVMQFKLIVNEPDGQAAPSPAPAQAPPAPDPFDDPFGDGGI